MAATKQIRQRIKSIGNTRKITKAMEMVAAAKMKKSQDLALKSQSYSIEALKTLSILSNLDTTISHPFLAKNTNSKKSLLIVITSDRGLSGSYNSSAIKQASQYISESKNDIDVITIGKRGQDFFKSTDINLIATFTDLPANPQPSDLEGIFSIIKTDYVKGIYSTIDIVYTKFYSTIKTVATTQQLLPFVKPEIENTNKEYIFEPDQQSVLSSIVPKLMEILFYQYLLDSFASEYSNQMIAMKNASDNAKDIIDDLQILYNTLRQASITQELAEITSGAAALE
jgi:F-type H+-transporting ATPase subunit gamma